MTGKSDRSLWAVSQKTPCCLAERRKEALAAAREPRALLARLPRLCGLPAAGATGATGLLVLLVLLVLLGPPPGSRASPAAGELRAVMLQC